MKKKPVGDHNSELPTAPMSRPPAYLLRKLPCRMGQPGSEKSRQEALPLTGFSQATSPQLRRWRSRCFGLVGLVLGCRRRTRLSLHCGFVNHGTLFKLSSAQVAFGDKVEV